MQCCLRSFVLLLLFTSCASAQRTGSSTQSPRVELHTTSGDIVIEVDTLHAPVTGRNFLLYVDQGFYNGGQFHRAVTMDNQPNNNIKIEVIQASPDSSRQWLAPISLERTSVTGILHRDGAVSMARGTPDSATGEFFICINDQPELDFGGKRNPDGQGFAAFGRVVGGMDIVRAIQHSPVQAQRLTPTVKILSVRRL